MKKSLALAVLPCLAFAGLAAPADAGPSRGGQSLAVSVVASGVSASSTSVKAGSSLAFSGCGYVPGADIALYVAGPTATVFLGQVADSNGCFSSLDNTGAFEATQAGSYKGATYQSSRKRADATVTFTVAP